MDTACPISLVHFYIEYDCMSKNFRLILYSNLLYIGGKTYWTYSKRNYFFDIQYSAWPPDLKRDPAPALVLLMVSGFTC